MNAPAQKPWSQVTAGDLVSPDGTNWYRVTLVTGNTFSLHGPVTPVDMNAGADIPPTAMDPAALVWAISTEAPTAPPAGTAEQLLTSQLGATPVTTTTAAPAPQASAPVAGTLTPEQAQHLATQNGNLTARVAALETEVANLRTFLANFGTAAGAAFRAKG